MNCLTVLALITLPTLGCRNIDKRAPDTAAIVDTARPDIVVRERRPANSSPWSVTDSGAGVLRIGMTRDSLAIALHATPPRHTKADSGCAYLVIAGIPGGLRTMWVAATLARIDIVAAGLPTDRGASIGDSEARIDSLYRGRMTSMPAKYDPRGKYLVVRPASALDSARRIVFETDSTKRVSRYRVGREPEVEWVEGCS